MVARNGRTGAIVLPHDQWDMLKKLAYYRAINGKQTRPSVSETMRDLIDDWEDKILEELSSYGEKF